MLAEGRTLLDDTGNSRGEMTLLARTLQDQLVGGVRRVLWMLMAAVSVVSVIATVNIALLLLVRGASRAREFSIRLALGAGRGQLVRQLFVEGLDARRARRRRRPAAGRRRRWTLLLRLAPADMPRLQEAALNGPVLAFALAVTVSTSLVFGILSAGRTLAIDPVRALGGSGGESRLMATPARRAAG